jgi:hypothetical protein
VVSRTVAVALRMRAPAVGVPERVDPDAPARQRELLKMTRTDQLSALIDRRIAVLSDSRALLGRRSFCGS